MLKCILVAAAWMAFVDYGGPANNRNANAATRGTAAPMADALLDLEKHATEAFFKGDGRFFERVLSDKLVMTEGGHRISKTSFIKRVTGSKCKVQEGWSLTDPQIEKIDDDTYVLSYKATVDCVCTYSGRTEKQASPVRAATVWVRNDEKWQAAFHGENPIVEPKALSAAGKTDESKQRNPKIGAPAASGSAKPNADPGTDALMAAEKSVWEAWKTKDAKKLESLTAQDITFVNIFGTYFCQ